MIHCLDKVQKFKRKIKQNKVTKGKKDFTIPITRSDRFFIVLPSPRKVSIFRNGRDLPNFHITTFRVTLFTTPAQITPLSYCCSCKRCRDAPCYGRLYFGQVSLSEVGNKPKLQMQNVKQITYSYCKF